MDIIGNDPATQAAIDIVNQHVFFKPIQGEGWQSKPELPTSKEIMAEEKDLKPLPDNPVDAAWPSKDEYLTAQYEILRREATDGLRFCVRRFLARSRNGRKEPKDDDFTNIYTQVRVKQYVMSNIGPLVRVSFSTERSNFRIQWLQSKRLQPGKIVALSTKSDGFNKICKIATVAQRPYQDGLDQDPPLVDLMWANPDDAVLDPTLEMVMIESLHGYFESARHALVGLQHVARTSSPLDKYLIGNCTGDTHPDFLKENPIVDISSLATRATEDDADVVAELKTHDIVNNQVPDMRNLTWLDESQFLGLHRIISKELAIVQGPPGTGKTYTSVEAIKTMIINNRRKSHPPPILVAAQTNHALDQILTHCINSGANVLRMGGRTQTEVIKPRTLFELRKGCNIPADKHRRSLDRLRGDNTKKIQELVRSLFSDQLLNPDALKDFGIITEAQHASLVDDEMETHDSVDIHGPFALWLGESLIPAKIREDRHQTQHELSEAEARKNLPEFEYEDDEDIENIADDEEALYRLRGDAITLRHVWTGKDPAKFTSSGRAVQRALLKSNLFDIDPDLRGAVYQYFQAKLLEAKTRDFAVLLTQNMELCKKRKAAGFLGNAQLVADQRIDIVGCTTTGLTKYRGCLAAMQPLSMLIEEAAETREANIVSALYPSIQQLILVGDHKQLAPKCDIMWLGDAPYNLNVSLFQRMVNLSMPFVMLNQQRRMKPELRQILTPFYPELTDHPSVKSMNSHPEVLGMGGRNSWLFDHKWPEEMNSDCSKLNPQEADMIVHFFAYLVRNGTPAATITVLTFYKGQRKILLGKLRRHPSIIGSVFNVHTVDSYQGEENDIILLSLVRSPQSDRNYAVGFLEDERRAVVAISRARLGFYVFGNVENVLNAQQISPDLWYNICNGFAQQNRYNRELGLPIVCQPHQRLLWMKDPADWGDNSGGCDLPCGQTRHCGHPCTLKCHVLFHEDLPCGQPCHEKLVCGHGCQRMCGQKCFCNCPTFEAANRPAQSAGQQMSLEQRILQMGAEPTEILMRSLNQQNASRQQAQHPPGLPPQGMGLSGAGRKIRTLPRQPPSAAMAQTAAQWEQFVDNIEQHDAQLLQERLASAGPRATETVIRDVYQPTGLADGRRIEGGRRVVQQVQLSNNHVVVDLFHGQTLVPDIQSGMNNLTLTNGVHHSEAGVSTNPPGVDKSSNAATTNSQHGQHQGANSRSGKGARKSPTKAGPTKQNCGVQNPPSQQPVTQPAPAQQPRLQTQSNAIQQRGPCQDLLDQSGPINDGNFDSLLGYEVSPHLLAQFGTLAPSGAPIPVAPAQVQEDLVQFEPLIPVEGDLMPNNNGQTGPAPTAALAAPPPAQGHGQSQSQGEGQVQCQTNVDEEDEWLIEL